MKFFSLNMRTRLFEENADDVLIALITITHPDLDEPLHLSSDPTKILQTDPDVKYGTTSNGVDYFFALMGVFLPSDEEDEAPNVSFVFDNVDMAVVEATQLSIYSADISVKLCLASEPDLIEDNWIGMEVVSSSFDQDRVTLEVSRPNFAMEPWPFYRMTARVAPTLFRQPPVSGGN